jgi:hypothetical protein
MSDMTNPTTNKEAETKDINLKGVPVVVLKKIADIATRERRSRHEQMIWVLEHYANTYTGAPTKLS